MRVDEKRMRSLMGKRMRYLTKIDSMYNFDTSISSCDIGKKHSVNESLYSECIVNEEKSMMSRKNVRFILKKKGQRWKYL